jgi:hypothetical protein
MAKRKKWVVTTSGDRPISDVEKDLSGSGFSVDHVLEAIGSITGSGDDKVAKRLREIPGVADVSEEPPPINIGPPDAPVS